MIQLFKTNDSLSLIVKDDGKGFDYKTAIASGGLGLKNINSRVEFLNGKIDWDSGLGTGTIITVNIPEIL